MYPKKLSHTVNNKSRSIGRVMVAIIVLLYIATTINFFLNVAFLRYVFIEGVVNIFDDNDVSFDREGYLAFRISQTWASIGIGVTALMSTVIADSVMVCSIFVANLDINLVLYYKF